MRFSNQLPVISAGSRAKKGGFAGDRRLQIPPPLLVVGLQRGRIELAERVVPSRRAAAGGRPGSTAISARSARSTKVRAPPTR